MNKRAKAGQENYRDQYIELAKTVKKLTRTSKINYEINFFKYIDKNNELVGPLKIDKEEMVSLGEDV